MKYSIRLRKSVLFSIYSKLLLIYLLVEFKINSKCLIPYNIKNSDSSFFFNK